MRLLNTILFPIFFISNPLVFAQVSLSEIIEDKSEMADSYYGTFKYNGEVFTGRAVAYHSNGKIKTLRSFKNGMYHGWWTEWYANGHRKFQGNRRINKGHGLTRWWYENGQLKKQGTYDMDKQQGVVIRWYENGNLMQIRHYERDMAVGPWTKFQPNGDVMDEGNEENLFYRPFFGNDVAPPGFEDASPSFTSDGKTMVFARYVDWGKKMAFIAYFENGKWLQKRLNFVDTLYNLAISPDGNRIIYKTNEVLSGEEVSKVYVVDKQGQKWGMPKEVKSLFNIHAGYFSFSPSGALYVFARSPETGVYKCNPDNKMVYSKPVWMGDELSVDGGDSFDVLVNSKEDKLILSQYYGKKLATVLGEVGFYYFEKVGEKWKRIKRLPIGYGWGPCVTPDGKFVFVRKGNLQYLMLEELGIVWD